MKHKLIFTLLALMLFMGAFSMPAWAYVPPDADTGAPKTESAIPAGDLRPATTGRTITPDGSGTVMDKLSSQDGKEFYTIKTPDENVFYLVIDTERGGDNVYFLNAVTEDDLMSLAQKKENKGTSTSAIPTQPTEPKETEPSPSPEPEPKPPEKSGGNGSLILLVIVVIAAGGAGYYFKIYHPKQQAPADDEQDDDLDYEDNDLDDDYESDDESEDD